MKAPKSISTIQLTRIHAINWYGFCDSFDLAGQTIVTGVYGCGKTGLVDLIQTVLLGPPERESRYNLALSGIGGTGREVKRDLRGYCLQDLNLDEHGHAVYGRKSTRTYIALEFTWPENARRETWGIRVEYPSVGADPATLFWKVPARLAFSDFLDAKEIPLSADEWERLLAGHRERPFPSRGSYLEALSAGQHLNFNPRIFKPLLLQTLRFSFGKDFTEFCRNNILPEDVIDLEAVRASYDRYKSLVDRMRLLEEQDTVLADIQERFGQLQQLNDEILALAWFKEKSAPEEAKQNLEKQEGALQAIRAATSKWQARQSELETTKAQLDASLSQALRDLRRDPQGTSFEHLKSRQKALPREIEDMKAVIADPIAELRNAHRRCEVLWEEAQQSGKTYDWATPSAKGVPILPKQLNANELTQLSSELVAALDPLAAHYDRIARDAEEQQRSLDTRVVNLRTAISRLKDRKVTAELPLHEALLAKWGPGRVKLVGSLCEVKDEVWTDALEINFVHKFATLVGNEDLKEAFSVLCRLPRVDGRERLLCPRDFQTLSGTMRRGSLAEKITTQDHGVRRLLDHLYGEVICCETIDEAESHPRAILPNGATKEPTGRRRHRESPAEYLIGEAGRKKMIALKQSDLAVLLPQQSRANQQATSARKLAGGFQAIKESLLQLSTDKVQGYRRLEEKLEEQRQVHSDLDRFADRTALENLYDQKEKLVRKLDDAVGELRDHRQMEPAGLKDAETAVASAQSDVNRTETAFLKWQKGNSNALEAASRHQQLEKEIKYDVGPGRNATTVADLMSSRRQTEKVRLQGEIRERRLRLKTDSRFTEYRDCDVEDFQDNTFFDKKLFYIRDSGIRDLSTEAAKAEVEWEDRFQRQVLGQLSHRLSEIRQTFDALRRIIAGHEIGGATYEFSYRSVEKKDFLGLRDLATELETEGLLGANDPKLADLKQRRKAAMDTLTAKPNDPASAERVRALLDARQYFTYDMEITEAGRTEKISLERRGRKASGGETYNPYFIALMTAYLRAYWRHDNKARPSISLLLMDEAFKVLNSEAVRDCVKIIGQLGLQGVISCTDTNGGQIVEFFQWVMIVQKRVTPGAKGEHDQIENTIYAAPRNDPEIAKLIGELE